MSELQFPKDPIVGQQYDFSPYKYYWDGVKWKTMGIGYNPVNDLRDEVLPTTREAIRRSYAEAGFTLVDGSFEEGGTLTSASDVLLQESTGVAYGWTGALPKTVSPGEDPTADAQWVPRTDETLRNEIHPILVGNDEECLFFSAYLPDGFAQSYDGTVGDDATTYYQQAVTDAVTGGKILVVDGGGYAFTGAQIEAPLGTLRIRFENTPRFYIGGWANKTGISGNFKYWMKCNVGGNTNYQEALRVDDLILEGSVRYVNLDETTANTQVYSCRCFSRYMFIRGPIFTEGFSSFGWFGTVYTIAGVNSESDSEYTGTHLEISRVFGWSDASSIDGQFHNADSFASVDSFGHHFVGKGAGKLWRFNGGQLGTITKPYRGMTGVHVHDSYFRTEAGTTEWNQFSKITGGQVSNCFFDAHLRATSDNAIDCFNCTSINLVNVTVVGGGIAFFGHADVGSFTGDRTNLVGVRGFSATNCTLINPTHHSAFNFGGDSSVGSLQGGRYANITNCNVFMDDDHVLPQDFSFLYAFLFLHINITGGTVQRANNLLWLSYVERIHISGMQLIDVPYMVKPGSTVTGDSINVDSIFYYGTSKSGNTFESAKPLGGTALKAKHIEGSLSCEQDVGVIGTLYGYKGNGSYVAGSTVSLDVGGSQLRASTEGASYEVIVTATPGGTVPGVGIYLVSFGGASFANPVVTNIVAMSNLTVSVSGSVITATSTSGTRTVRMSVTKRL